MNTIRKGKVHALLWMFTFLSLLCFTTPYVFAENPLVGTWGYTLLGHAGPWYTWKTEAGTVTFDANGNAINIFKESANTCPNEHYCMSSDTTNLTYTINQDGTFTLAGVMKLVISDDKTVIIGDGTSIGDEQILFVGVKMDPAKTYSMADVAGDYYSGAYEYDALGNPPPTGRGHYRVQSVTSSLNNGNILMNGTMNGDGTIIPVSNQQGTYTVNADGSMLMNGAVTGYAGAGNVAIFSNPNLQGGVATDFASFIALKKADKQYSAADLQGTWAYTGFGDYGGTTFRSEFGTITCDQNGSCTVSIKIKRSDGTTTSNFSASLNLTASSDGALNGFFLTNATPHFSGAIGNDGNTMILVMNTSGQNTNDRALGVAVKCSTCSNTGGGPDITSISLSQGWNFVSFPKLPTTATVATVFADVVSNVRIIWGYNNSTKAWKKYKPGATDNSLSTIEGGKGYWVYMNASGNIDISGWSTPNTLVHLDEGWNLIGYSGTDNKGLSSALNSISGTWDIIWGWGAGQWYAKHATLTNLSVPPLSSLNQGKAYWIKINPGQATDWTQ